MIESAGLAWLPIDANTLVRLPLFDTAGLQPLVLPDAEQVVLDGRVRATSRLTRQAAEHKRRIRDLARQLMPVSPLTADLGAADLAVLERCADPRVLARLTTMIAKASHGHQGRFRVRRRGRKARPGRASQFRFCTGVAPKASEAGETDRKSQPMSKAGSSLLRTTMVRVVDNARKQDPPLARIYYLQMTERTTCR